MTRSRRDLLPQVITKTFSHVLDLRWHPHAIVQGFEIYTEDRQSRLVPLGLRFAHGDPSPNIWLTKMEEVA